MANDYRAMFNNCHELEELCWANDLHNLGERIADLLLVVQSENATEISKEFNAFIAAARQDLTKILPNNQIVQPQPADGPATEMPAQRSLNSTTTTTVNGLPMNIYSTLPLEEPEFLEIAIEFRETLKTKLAEMRQAAVAGNSVELASLAHWLKGAGGTCGFDDFYHPALELEIAAKSGAADQYDSMIRVLEHLSNAMVIAPGATI